MVGHGSITQGALPIFDEKLFGDGKIKMLAIFGFQDVAEVVEGGLVEPQNKASDEKKKNYKQQQKLDNKARFLIYMCVRSKI